MKNNVIEEKSFRFAVRICRLCAYLRGKREYVITNQLARSGTSVGANVSEAVQAISRADFRAKMNIALKEASESEYWIRLLMATNLINKKEFNSIYNDCVELEKILTAIIKSIDNNNESA